MKAFLLFLAAITLILNTSNGQMKYWEDFSNVQKTEILGNCKSVLMKNFYDGKFVPTDNEKTWALLNDIISSGDTLLPLSFYLFNKICKKSDGALSEMVVDFCAKYLAKHPKYILTFFSRERYLGVHDPIWKKYSLFVGMELNFKKNGSSALAYNYQGYKEMLANASKGCKENEETFKVFWQLVDETIRNMN
jgi:hypothetical protein